MNAPQSMEMISAQHLVANDVNELVNLIRERYQRRTSWQKAENKLILQGKAICRRFCDGDKDRANKLYDEISKIDPMTVMHMIISQDKSRGLEILHALNEVHPLLRAQRLMAEDREIVEDELEMLVKQLPHSFLDFIDSVSGVSYLSAASIIGACGDLRNYEKFSQLQKRMGIAVIDGVRQRKWRDKALAEKHGYVPDRRSLLWRIGYSILMAQSERVDKKTGEIKREAGPWRIMYNERKQLESERNEEGRYADLAQSILNEKQFARTTVAYKSYVQGKLPPLHLHQRAKRYIEKRFLRQMWAVWKKAFGNMPLPESEPQTIKMNQLPAEPTE